ncbi:hypothetical protein FDP41_003497 [Naegleria fowleri]|uniref:Uncharacterized protein n=1 Tax=Naegleria fowleri TaxID=5763 RepID=A0A6A5BVY8_NAEFO|nr:uncharacterized protein FDP41_003497 [Naegleria fowleri]KAF0977505.1 hypothetical protein FDP41_003497 [Naegleria fowleri]CAG4715009.1 unnamed protein product [Naegleria fowleri]
MSKSQSQPVTTSYASRVIKKIKGNNGMMGGRTASPHVMNTYSNPNNQIDLKSSSSFKNRLLRVVNHLRPSSYEFYYSDPSSPHGGGGGSGSGGGTQSDHHHSMLLATLDSNLHTTHHRPSSTTAQHGTFEMSEDHQSSLSFLHHQQQSSPLFHHLFSHDSSINNSTHSSSQHNTMIHGSLRDSHDSDHIFIHPIQSLSKLFQFIRNTYYVLEMVDEDEDMKRSIPIENNSKSSSNNQSNEKEHRFKSSSPVGFELDENDPIMDSSFQLEVMNHNSTKVMNSTIIDQSSHTPFYSNIDKFLFRLFVSNDTNDATTCHPQTPGGNSTILTATHTAHPSGKSTVPTTTVPTTSTLHRNTTTDRKTSISEISSHHLQQGDDSNKNTFMDPLSISTTLLSHHHHGLSNSNLSTTQQHSIHFNSPTTSNVIIFFIETIFSVIKSLSLITLVTVSYIHKRFDKYLKPIIVIEFGKLEKLLGKLIYNFKLYFKIGTNAKLTIARLLAKIRNNNPRNFYMILSIYLRMRNWMHIPKSFINQIFWTVTSIYFNILLFCIYLIEKIVSPRLLYLLTMTNDKLIEILDRVLSFVESYYHIVIENDRMVGVKRHSTLSSTQSMKTSISPLQGTEN